MEIDFKSSAIQYGKKNKKYLSLCQNWLQLASEILDPPGIFPLNPIVSKSCNIESCGNKMHQIIANLIVSEYLQLNYM